jgi:sterol desaturase/sphingolipid hydroxylase (fatty acid hydroxylase superfamily)
MIEDFTYSFFTLIFVGACCNLLSLLSPSVKSKKLHLTYPDLKTDIKYWAMFEILGMTITRVLVVYCLVVLGIIGINYQGEANYLAALPHFAKLLICLIFIDFLSYVLHRCFHRNSLWKYHAIHHSPKRLEWLSSIRFHFFESIVIIMTVYTLAIIAGFSTKIAGSAILIRYFYGFMVHTNLSWNFGKLGYVFASPYFHRWHHSKNKEAIDKNFGGVFSAWDFIFGTAYFPKNKQPENFGINDDIGNSFAAQLLSPYTK